MRQHSKESQNWETKLNRLMLKSRENPDMVFNNLGHLLCLDMLRSCYKSLSGSKASGIDKMTKEKYGEKLETNLKELLSRIRQGNYKPQPTRLVEIPKADGQKRPLEIGCFEDKIVQSAVCLILENIYEPHFLDCSYGFRPKRNCHAALQALDNNLSLGYTGAVIDADIRQCFTSISHEKLVEIISAKINDSRFLQLITKLIKTKMLDNIGEMHVNAVGVTQGSTLSPLLCNIFLHEVLDKWFKDINVREFNGACTLVRYADDLVCTTAGIKSAEVLLTKISIRLKEYGLEIHPDKTKVIKSGKKLALKALSNKEKFTTFDFLGFTHLWAVSQNRKTKQKFARVKRLTSTKRFRRSLKQMKDFIIRNRHSVLLIDTVKRKVVGYLNYYAINDNQRKINQFVNEVKRMLFKWLNRRSQKRGMTWEKFIEILKKNRFPQPIILHNLFFNGKNYIKS